MTLFQVKVGYRLKKAWKACFVGFEKSLSHYNQYIQDMFSTVILWHNVKLLWHDVKLLKIIVQSDPPLQLKTYEALNIKYMSVKK